MMNFDHLSTQLNKLKNQISGIAKFFDVVSFGFLFIFYIIMICINTSDLVRLIIYSILTGLTLAMLVIDVLSLFKKFQRIKEFTKKHKAKKYYTYVKQIVVLASLIYSGYLIYSTKTSMLSLSIYILSVLFYVFSLIMNFIKNVGGRIINNLLVSLRMDLETNYAGSLLKELKIYDVTHASKIANEDKIKAKIGKETAIFTKDKPKKVEEERPSLYKVLTKSMGEYRNNNSLRKAIEGEDIDNYFLEQRTKSLATFINKNKLTELMDDVESMVYLPNYVDYKDDILMIVNYVRERQNKIVIGLKTEVTTSITMLRLLKEYKSKDTFEPFLKYVKNILDVSNVVGD